LGPYVPRPHSISQMTYIVPDLEVLMSDEAWSIVN
jgi:hypothetical protein